MALWAVVIPGERYEAERLYHHDTVEVTGVPAGPVPGDEVLVVVRLAEPAVVALGRVARQPAGPASLVVAYSRRCFDDPLPAPGLTLDGPLAPVEPAAFRALAARLGPVGADARTWLVSLDLPIEAESPAEAVRRFWSYVRELGPRELPTFVSPSGDELAMQAFVLGEQANLDPEEEDD